GVRIWKSERTVNEIKDNMYRKMHYESEHAHFNFDKSTNMLIDRGATVPLVNIFDGLAHISSSHINKDKELTSPILSDESEILNSNFTSSSKHFFVPDGSTTGIKDSIFISSSSAIANLKVYVLMSHTFISDMNIKLIS